MLNVLAGIAGTAIAAGLCFLLMLMLATAIKMALKDLKDSFSED